MANKYYSNCNAYPTAQQPTPPPPGTKGVTTKTPSFTPVSEEPKKGLS